MNQYGKGPMVDDEFNYLGKYAIEVYSQATGVEQKSVPIEDGSSAPGAGSIGSHRREGTFDDELMTPISNGSNGMGAMTIGAMKDLGYEINPIKTQVRNQLELGIWNGEDQLTISNQKEYLLTTRQEFQGHSTQASAAIPHSISTIQ